MLIFCCNEIPPGSVTVLLLTQTVYGLNFGRSENAIDDEGI